jgi:aldehyde:ferredoxin oxidoreductase
MIRARVEQLLERLPREPQYPTQGATLFVDLARQQIESAYTPRPIVEAFLEGRGANMFYLYNLLDPHREPLDPEVPLIIAAGLLTGIVPSAARGQVTGVSPESRLLMDSNAGDFFPSYLKLQGIDRLVLYGEASSWTYLYLRDGAVELRDGTPYVGMDNLELRERVAADLGGRWGRDLAMANIARSGENGVLMAGIMAGPKALWARGGPGAKMGSLRLKAIVLQGFDAKRAKGHAAAQIKPANRRLAHQLLATGVVKHALSVRGTPFLYKPSRLLGAMGTKNNQETRWTAALDAENMDRYRPKMAGCFRCPVNCRPLNDLDAPAAGEPATGADRYRKGDGPEYVTVGKLGPMIGLSSVEQVIRLNNIANDLGMDTASLGSSLAWAMELWQRGIIGPDQTEGLTLSFGNYPTIEKLLFLTAAREGFGDVIADSAAAVERGKYPAAALDYRMAVKGMMQSDPHDGRIIKAFALGLAVSTRGMDHLRNRATLEINARINDDPEYKRQLYGGPVAAEPNVYEGKERAVRTCEDQFAVGDALGMCRFTTKLFNSPSLPGYDELSLQIANVTGIERSADELKQVGRNISGLERMINHRLGARRRDDTLPRRWFDEPVTVGPFAGEKIDRAEFDALLTRFYALSGLNDEGQPQLRWRSELLNLVAGFAVQVSLPASLAALPEGGLVVSEPVANVGQLAEVLSREVPGFSAAFDEGSLAVAINGELVVGQRQQRAIENGDRIELLPALAGG